MKNAATSDVLLFRLTCLRAEQIVRERAKDSANVILGAHARERMVEREITDIEVIRVLRQGTIMEQPEKMEHGEWKCKVVMKIRGERDAGVVTIILLSDKLFIKTVGWEDWR